eukprot:CAMPEP_0169072510 /NCGR_PEP_ID=MMETSP1015-20121227/6236_1 /TAXON_ID=342587 /ORGANISM="Karlodinium micrum, Strain CCMP2283" /LENGTH=76 /DNA_ID=CAMNT_0009131677 /DNA_START=62 /DNA_END=289 /DNA_ORIENTATION=-
MLGRTAARATLRVNPVAMQSCLSSTAANLGSLRSLSMTPRRLGGDYDWNMGTPGSRIKNPAPHLYNDVYPDMGWQW